MTPAHDAPPAHDSVGPITRTIEILCLAAAALLLVVQAFRLATGVGLAWWVPVIIVVGGVTADLVSGFVHWTADTWGRETLPVVGRRFLRPFRVHHINPHDFLRRDFIDCNGDVAMLVLPMLAAAMLIPLGTGWSDVAGVFLVSFATWMLPTNQVHQWAHMPHPPHLVAWLQRHGAILSREAHQEHHASPYVVNYCIATGWCNRWLTKRQVFPRLERTIARVTGMLPRAPDEDDEEAFAAHLRASTGAGRR
jgi:ubiquitin-conjugating enzyme E2 variant